jgi:diaminopimelate decarboxylase
MNVIRTPNSAPDIEAPASRRSSPPLPALRSSDVDDLLTNRRRLLFELTDGLGSPLHIVLPGAMDAAVKAFSRVFDQAGVRGSICYAVKANKAKTFLHTAAKSGIGVDVASVEEFAVAIGTGINPRSIVVTGPTKTPALHDLAIRHGAVITVDCLEELAAIQGTGPVGDGPVRVVLRFRPHQECGSRFGMDTDDLHEAMRRSAECRVTRLEGFSVHLSGYEAAPRGEAGHAMMGFVDAGRALGLRPHAIDLGGGWPVAYCSAVDWDRFAGADPRDFCHGAKDFGGFYPYGGRLGGPAALDRCLRTIRGDMSLAAAAASRDLVVHVQPGRALLDQAGLSLFRVQGVRTSEPGNGIVTVEGQSFSLSEQWFGSEFCPDPVLISRSAAAPGPFVAPIGGASCLDGDMLAWRRIPFVNVPRCGDLIAFINTAGYQMDSNESPFHRRPLPRKVAAWSAHDQWSWCLDAEFGSVSAAPWREL